MNKDLWYLEQTLGRGCQVDIINNLNQKLKQISCIHQEVSDFIRNKRVQYANDLKYNTFLLIDVYGSRQANVPFSDQKHYIDNLLTECLKTYVSQAKRLLKDLQEDCLAKLEKVITEF